MSAVSVEDIVESYALLSPQNDEVTATGIAGLLRQLGYNNIDEDSIRIRLKALHGKEGLSIRDFVTLYKSGEFSAQELDARAIHSAFNLLLHIPRSGSFLEAASETPPMTLTTSASELADALEFSGSSLLTDKDMSMLVQMGLVSRQKLGAQRNSKPPELSRQASGTPSAAQRLGYTSTQEVSIVSIANRLAQLASTLATPPNVSMSKQGSISLSAISQPSSGNISSETKDAGGLIATPANIAIPRRRDLITPIPGAAPVSNATPSTARTPAQPNSAALTTTSSTSALLSQARASIIPRPPSNLSVYSTSSGIGGTRGLRGSMKR